MELFEGLQSYGKEAVLTIDWASLMNRYILLSTYVQSEIFHKKAFPKRKGFACCFQLEIN
jgi:hypothetical protein